ncbi:NADPH-dependent 7-cyano-7-deazaguanine reductase QueF [Thalassotalea maritima]|uniref:NADPH-dependent 7-cyano-7-deazaguanine reductase QueF n=1 Tax=Thalassotalea maritima TaxID=3242416 RepID=UPI003527C50B
MSKYSHRDELKSLVLGKTTEYKSQYAPELLQAVPRSLNRDDLNLGEKLPFQGEDVWYGYELSWLNSRGKPIVAVAEFRIPCESDNLIESKSFKLYLNSFNQSRFDDINDVEVTLQQDLSKTANAPVTVKLFAVNNCPALAINESQGICLDDLDISIDDYQFNREILANASDSSVQVDERLHSHLLKSNCLITNQPDWGSVYIDYKGAKINQEQLLRYIISFRMHNEFHEQCVERIFTDIMAFCQPEELTVFARYTRRGGLDINPYRSNVNAIAPTSRTLRQ